MKIQYDCLHKQDIYGNFDIVFEPLAQDEEWKINIVDLISCILLSNKRLPDYLIEQNHITLRGGSPCDMVYNITGKYYGSLIHFYANCNDALDIKRTNIQDAINQAMQDIKNQGFITDYTLDAGVVDSKNSSLLFNLTIFTINGSYKQNFSIKYANN